MSINKKQLNESLVLELVDSLAEKIGNYPAVLKVILYGSRARGDAASRADIDLAVLCPEANHDSWRNIKDEVSNARTLLNIDLVRLDEVSEELRQTIIKEGKILYESGKN